MSKNHKIGSAFYVPGSNIDTDRIIPARFLVCVNFQGLEKHAFEDDRLAAKRGGQLHPWDNPENDTCEFLVVDENFGSGSSREHAVVAIQRRPIRVIIGLSFAEIFRSNATLNGLACVDVSPEVHQKLLAYLEKERKENLVTIDLERMEIVLGTEETEPLPITMPNEDRYMLTEGGDAITMLLQADEATAALASQFHEPELELAG